MEGIKVKYEIEVNLPVEIPEEDYVKLLDLFSEHILNFLEKKYYKGKHVTANSSIRIVE
ncbi:hypothetical protein MYRA21_0108 [Myroides sp. A21]|uniref:hypothetical protein n=1 Tax=Myroides sp. A21 TaxID=1583100 RepID=UPI0005861FBF|nr:hypothetical protein [Myroides sp. A21]AJA67352.1 hypothetical protein MYRA21_0108 [Myroides sp. A21]